MVGIRPVRRSLFFADIAFSALPFRSSDRRNGADKALGSTNNVQLPDEYDQIHRDVQPFHALSPRDLQKRIETASKRSDTYTIEVRHGTVRTSASYDNSINGADERLSGQTELIAPIAQYLGDLKVVYSVHDTPAILLSWGHRSELLEHIEEDECA